MAEMPGLECLQLSWPFSHRHKVIAAAPELALVFKAESMSKGLAS